MKKILCLMLAVSVLFTLAACSKKQEGTLVAYRNDEGDIVTEYVADVSENEGEKDIDGEVRVTMPLVFVDENTKMTLQHFVRQIIT